MTKSIATAAGILLLFSASASALTVNNKGTDAITIGLDAGSKEKVEKVAAGKSAKIDGFCAEDGCGVTGPWGYSVMTKPGDTLVYQDGEAWTQKGS